MKNHIIVKGVGWSQSAGTNWCYQYYDVTIISNNREALALQGVYENTFGSVTNDRGTLREIEGLDVIWDDHLSETKQSRRAMVKLTVGTDLKAIIKALTN